MKPVINIIAVIFTFACISVVYADKGAASTSPESIVACQGAGPQMYAVIGMSLPASINDAQCVESADGFPRHCAPCIISLEDQGCKIVDAITGEVNNFLNVTYLLSCAKP